MIVLYEKGLKNEAEIVRAAIESFFGIPCTTKQGSALGAHTFNKKLNGYELLTTKKFQKVSILTSKDIYQPGSISPEDDWVFGYATKNKQFIVSIARLKSKTDAPSKRLQVPFSKYAGRLPFIILHELGHWLVKEQAHFKKFVWQNPETGYHTELGYHCPDKRCIMAEFIDVEDLDKHIRTNYKKKFCRKCASNGFAVNSLK
ncbi:hypothetical protein HY642_04500 [Candidatus Woesearchaeota archaeon]|nr:hypothetical protein [Candidatus Woesearchaeota archaeon]